MSATGDCLPIEELARLAAESDETGRNGSMPRAVAEHLARCEACRGALADVRGTEVFLANFADALSAPSGAGEAAAAAPPTLDGYRIGAEIRHGGQGIVYRATHEASAREVALKVVRAGSHRRRARIEREAALAARLRHPNIVTIHDCGSLDDGRFAIALELVDGQPLDEWARETARTHPGTEGRLLRLRVFARICDAIEHAHRHGVIHCDLKPDNILVDRDGEPRVLDFGVARAAGLDESPRITVTGEIACTIAYASPEQLTSDRASVDTRTDVYSLGVILYELLTFRLPHGAERGISELVASISHSPPPAPSTHALAPHESRIDRDLDTIALTALAKDPDRRYATAAALKADVLHFLAGEPIAARRDSVMYVLRKALVRHRRVAAIATVAALAALIGIAATVVASIRAREAALREESERSRMRAEAQRGDAVAEMLRELIPSADSGDGDANTHDTIDLMSLSLESGTFSDDPEAAAAARIAIGDVLVDRHRVRRAEVEYRQAVRLLRGRAAPNDPFLGTAEERLALLLLRRSAADEALALARSADAIRRTTLGDDHPDTLHGLCTLADVYVLRGDQSEAERILARIESHPIVLSGRDADPMDAVHETRAGIAAARGDAAARLRHCEARLRAAFVAHGDAHPAVHAAVDGLIAALPSDDPRGPTLAAIASLLATRELVEADPDQLRLLLEEKRTILGPDHPDLVETLLQLANRLTALERWQETVDACLEAERIAMPDGIAKTVGEADLLELRADALWFVHRPAEAAEVGERQLAALRPLLRGKDEMHLAIRIKELSFRHIDAGNLARARELGDEAIETVRGISPHDPQLGWMYSEISSNELKMKNVTRALDLASRGIAILESTDDSYAWHRSIARYRRAVILHRMGRDDEARADLDLALRAMANPAIASRDRMLGQPPLDELDRELRSLAAPHGDAR